MKPHCIFRLERNDATITTTLTVIRFVFSFSLFPLHAPAWVCDRTRYVRDSIFEYLYVLRGSSCPVMYNVMCVDFFIPVRMFAVTLWTIFITRHRSTVRSPVQIDVSTVSPAKCYRQRSVAKRDLVQSVVSNSEKFTQSLLLKDSYLGERYLP